MAETARIDVWGAVRDERNALLADLEGLRAEDWNAQSLCSDWRVRDVVAHLVAGVEASGAALVLAMARSGFNINRMLRDDARRRSRGQSPDALVAAYRATIGSQRTPPSARPWQMLSDTVIHGQDIRRPLGLRRDFPTDRLTFVMDRLAATQPILGVKGRVSGLRLRAVDCDWTHGDGPEVTGRAEALLLAMTGRPVALDELEGDGVPLLRARLSPN
jgi:uncharacterized protein (TIGR03083 family)